MKESEIVKIALESLQKTAGITGKWKKNVHKELDGKLEFKLENQAFTLNVDVKGELRAHRDQAHYKFWTVDGVVA